jgi:hypothetical protein
MMNDYSKHVEDFIINKIRSASRWFYIYIYIYYPQSVFIPQSVRQITSCDTSAKTGFDKGHRKICTSWTECLKELLNKK